MTKQNLNIEAPTYTRRKTHTVRVGNVSTGSEHPIVVQSMTNTATEDIAASVKQVHELYEAGSEVVRLTVNTEEAAKAIPHIREKLDDMGCYVPLVGDFHYNGHRLLADEPACAEALAKYRINPGNVGFGSKRDSQFTQMIEKAIEYNKPVRIGVNWGSLDQALLTELMDQNATSANPLPANEISELALVESVLRNAKLAEEIGLPSNKIIVSCKVSRVQELIRVYRRLGAQCEYPLHLGLTEAGMGSKGIVASTAALSVLLQEGLGDTIRISLTPEPGQSRTQEVIVAQEILQTMDLRAFSPLVTACPGCGRTTSTFFQELAQQIQQFIRKSMPNWRKTYAGVENMNVAVMGCIVNGPGESKHANIGISLPGTGESPAAPVFVDGKKVKTLRGDGIATEFQTMVQDYVEQTYTKKTG